MSNDGRRTPPQWVAIVLMFLPMMVCLCVGVAVFTDWFQQAWHGLVWLASQWRVILLMALMLLTAAFGLAGGFWMARTCIIVYHALHDCRLTTEETRRCVVAGGFAMLFIPLVFCLTAWFIQTGLPGDDDSFTTLIYATVLPCFAVLGMLLDVDETNDMWESRLTQKLLPRRYELLQRLCQSAPPRVYNQLFGAVKPCDPDDKWVQAHLADLREYAAYHPEFAELLPDGKKK